METGGIGAQATVEPAEDAWGRALVDYLEGREVPELQLEVDDGGIGPAMQPEWFFRTFDAWDWWERELLAVIDDGPVLDLGCGAGRASLYLQEQGLEVTGIDSSPGAVEVCRRRGVADARLADLNDPPSDRRWSAVLLLCGNLGLGGSWDGNRALLRRLSELARPGALLVGDSVESIDASEIGLRIRYRDLVTPWWRQRNVGADEVPSLVDGTGWRIERQVRAGVDHAVLLRNDAR